MAVPTEVTSKHSRGATRDGLLLFRREWVASTPKATVLLIHGIGEHSGRYEHVGNRMSERGYSVVGIDTRGFGRSGGRRSWVGDFAHYLDDVEDQLDEVRDLGHPVVLLGHSMGGLIATSYAVSDRPQPDLIVLSGPALDSGLPGWLAAVPPLLVGVAPTMRLRGLFGVEVLSRDPDIGVAYQADDLVETRHTVKIVSELMEAMEEAVGRVDRIRVPTLVVHGGADELVPPSASEPLEASPEVERTVYPELRHEVFNELNWTDIVDDVLTWLDAQVGG